MTTAAEIIHGLKGNRHTGMCRCPAHDDRHPSLHVSECPGGKPLFHCKTGCTQDEVIAALKERALWKRSDMTAIHSDYDEEQEGSWDSWYRAQLIYRTAARAKLQPLEYLQGRGIQPDAVPPWLKLLPAEESARLTGKRYPAMVAPIFDGDGHFQGVQITWLDREAKTKLAVSDGKPRRTFGQLKGGYVPLGVIDNRPLCVIAAEGIEDALSVRQLIGDDCPAVAVLGSNFAAADAIKCEEMILAGDNDDDGGGRQKAEEAAALLGSGQRAVRIAIPEHYKDWNEALCDPEADPAKLRRAILHAEKVDMPSAIGPVPVAEFMQFTFPKRDVLIHPWLTSGSLVMAHAWRGNGKTWLALSVAFALANGTPLLGWNVTKRVRVMYVDGELSGEQLQSMRLGKFGCLPDNLFILSRNWLHVHKQPDIDLGTAELRNYLDKWIARDQIDVIILDSISTLVQSGIEDKAESWAPIGNWSFAHRWAGRSIIYLCHEGKNFTPRGTSKREDPFDTMIGLKENSEQTTEIETAFQLTYTKHRDFFGADAMPMMIYLSAPEGGVVQWRSEQLRDVQHEKVREMLDAGMMHKDIAGELGVTRSRVSQIGAAVTR